MGIKTIDTPEWTRCGLTNYHVIRCSLKGVSLKGAKGKDESTSVRKDTAVENTQVWSMDINGFHNGFWESVEGLVSLTAPPLGVHHGLVHDIGRLLSDIDQRGATTRHKASIRDQIQASRDE